MQGQQQQGQQQQGQLQQRQQEDPWIMNDPCGSRKAAAHERRQADHDDDDELDAQIARLRQSAEVAMKLSPPMPTRRRLRRCRQAQGPALAESADK